MADGYRVKSNNKREDPRLAKAKESGAVPKKIIVNKDFFRSSWLDSTMYNNQNYSGQGYQNSYPAYQQYSTGYGGYEGYNQTQYMSTNVQPVPPGEEYPQNTWAPVTTGYNQHPTNSIPQPTSKYASKEDEGVAQERKQQHAQLVKQREEYVRKATVLRRELELLRNQKQEILSENSSQRDMEPILKENDKLQDEIQSKMKAIYNVIEMLSSIIKDGSKISDLEAQLEDSPKPSHKNHHHHKNEIESGTKYNYMHYDPELHWCRICDEFPKTAKDLLLHLQSEKHKKNMNENDVGDNTPWHKLQPEAELPVYENAPKKRIPIRGLQFFIAAPAWYCKLCDMWIGDLHCASHHLKSQAHFQNYAHFVEQNPHWEIEWLKDREKAVSRRERHHHNRHSSDSESDKKKKKHHKNKKSSSESINNKDKKKKKRSKKRNNRKSDTSSSSSSSDSSTDDDDEDGNNDKSKSIRVVMRNMKVQSIMNEDLSGKWEMLERIVDEHKKKEEQQKQQIQHQIQKKETDDKLINQWMTVSEPPDKEKVMLDNLKDRMKQKQEQEKVKLAELEKKKKEKEREEQDRMDKKQREEQEYRDRYEREKRERERLEYERIRDKERESVRFKTTRENSRDNYRRKDSNTENSPDRQRSPIRDKESPKSEQNRHENGRSRSRSIDKEDAKKKMKRLPFIGRMPLFKNKKVEEKVEVKEIKKEEYDIPRRTRFQPGNLPKAFLPSPDVVCYPKLSSIPPLTTPPPPPRVSQPDPPAPPKISSDEDVKAPPAPKIGGTVEEDEKHDNQMNAYPTDENGYGMEMMDPNMMNYYQNMDYMMYNQMYDYSQCQQDDGQMPPPPPPPPPDDGVPLAHTMPLQPPPLPPNDPSDDLAMLGISVDDMAAQSF